jgi:hypothetical protein
MVVSMSDKEFSRLNVLLDVQANRLRIDDAAQLLNLKRRQIFRLLKAMREVGPAGLASKRRGRPSNNRLPTPVRELTMSLVKAHYADFGPTLALEKLTQFHSCPVSRETLRKWMIEDGLWIDRKHRLASVHQPRNRRERLGELIQIDGCKHYWFENRGPECTLLAFIDDATSRIMHAAFVPSESTLDYLRETKAYVTRHGRLPALSLPFGRDSASLPLPIQLIAPTGHEPTLLALASRLEAEERWTQPYAVAGLSETV